NSNRSHVQIQYSAKCVVRDSYFYGTKNAATVSYGIEVYQAGDLLIENNILQHISAPILVQPASGTVFAYNFDIDNYFSPNRAWQTLGPVWSHGAGTSMNLTEGNDGVGFIEDVIHGTHNFATVFRNRFSGLEAGRTTQTIPIVLQAYARYNNFMGTFSARQAITSTTRKMRLPAPACVINPFTRSDGLMPAAPPTLSY